MRVALGAAVAVTGASALIYILLRSRKRHPDPGKPDDATAIHSENVSPNKTSEKEAKLFTDKINASCSDVTCESKDTEDTSINKYPYVNFNGHVPINGKNSEILNDHVTESSNEISVSVKESCVIEQHADVCSENVAEVEVKRSSVDASSRQYPRIKNKETVMAYSSVVPLELSDVEEKDGSTEPFASQNLEENENISLNMVIKEDIISNTVPEKFSSNPVTLEMEKVTDMLGSFLEYDCHTTTVLAKEEKELMRGSGVHSVTLEKPAVSTSGVNDESNVMSDSEQNNELSTSLKLRGKEPSVLPSLGKKQALIDLCDFVLEKDSSVSPTIGRDQESVTFPSLDLNKEYTCLPDVSQSDSLGSSLSVQDENSTESLVLHKEGKSYISSSFEHEKHSILLSNLEDEKQSFVSSNFEQEEQSPLSSSLAIEEGSILSFDMDHGEKANEHSLHFSSMNQGEQLVLSSCLDQLKHSTLSPILAKEEGSTLSSSMDQEEESSMDQEEHDNHSSTVLLKQLSSATNLDQEDHHNLSSSTGITCSLGNEDQSNLSFCKHQEQAPVSLSITSKDGSAISLEGDQCSHSSCLNQVEQFTVSFNSNTEEHSTILFGEEEHVICSSSKKHEEQPYLSSTLDQEKECALSFNLTQDEEAVNLTQEEGFINLVQQEESILSKKEQSVVLPQLVSKEQSTLSTTLDQNQESDILLMESDKLCVQAQETSKDICLKSAKVKKEVCQKNSVLQKDKEIMSTSSECLAKEIVTINCVKGNIDLHQKASEQEEEEKMADRTQNASMKISTVGESSNIRTGELGELCSKTSEIMRESSSTGTPELRNVCSTESGKVRESNCTSIYMKESSVGVDNLKESSNTGIENLKESSNTGIGNSQESNITDTSKLKESNNASTSKLRESSNTVPCKLREGNVIGTSDLEGSTLKKTAVSDKGTLRKQFQENQRDSAAADLDHDSTSEQENINSDSLSVKSFDSSEIEPETLFNPSTFPVSSQEQYIFYEFEIPQTLVGRLIGRKGAFVNKVKATTDATVIVYPHKNRRLKLCSVEGTKQQVRAALDMIREHFPQNRYPDVTLAQVSTQPTVLTPAQPTLNTQAMQIELTSGVVVEVRVSAVVSAGELWVQQPLHPSFSALHRLQSCMNLNYGDGSNTPPLPSPVQDGTVCVAQIKKHWLRCQVLSTENDVSLVVLLDVGGTVSIATTLLRQIRYDYMTLPFQATQCFLHGVQPAKDDVWDDVSLAVMEEFVSDTILFATVVSYTEDGVPLVSLYRRDQDQYVHLNEKLVLLGHAQWVSPQPAS